MFHPHDVETHSEAKPPACLESLPDELLAKIQVNEALGHLAATSLRMHRLFQPQRLQHQFLQFVAYGNQNQAEALFNTIYSANDAKIQEVLRYSGTFTDYSDRTFCCSAYEYAYWAKDTHMCRMLARYMNQETKAITLAKIEKLAAAGLVYQQHGVTYQHAHFDFTPLISSLSAIFNANLPHDEVDSQYLAKELLMQVGQAQRDVPAHVAQEYCHPERSFDPCPSFAEDSFPRKMTYHHWAKGCEEAWFPLSASDTGLGYDFSYVRAAAPWILQWGWSSADLDAMIRLDAVRTLELVLLRENLAPATLAPGP